MLPEKAEVTASVWGTEAIPFGVKIESKVLEELTLIKGGMSSWKVETQRLVRNEEKMVFPYPWL